MGTSQSIVLIDNKWYNLTDFLPLHPGGSNIIKKFHMRDATIEFNKVKGHVNFGRSLNSYMITDENIIMKLNKSLKI
jgi:hypothetical protein